MMDKKALLGLGVALGLSSFVVAVPAFGEAALDGSYRFVGLTCQDANALTRAARDFNEVYINGSREGLVSFSKTGYTRKERIYKFKSFSAEACIIKVSGKTKMEGSKLTMTNDSVASEPTKEFDAEICRGNLPGTKAEISTANVTGNYLYLKPESMKSTNAFCKSGDVTMVFQKTTDSEFKTTKRADYPASEERIRAAIKTNSKQLVPIIDYVSLLIGDDRLQEANTYVEEAGKRSAKSPLVKLMRDLMSSLKQSKTLAERQGISAKFAQLMAAVRYKAQTDLQFQRAIAAMTATSDKGLNPGQKKLRDFYARYEFAKLGAVQYEPSAAELKAMRDARTTAKANTKTTVSNLTALERTYPNSPALQARIIKTMLEAKDLGGARTRTQKAVVQYPNQIAFKIFNNQFGSGARKPASNANDALARSRTELKLLDDTLALLSVQRAMQVSAAASRTTAASSK